MRKKAHRGQGSCLRSQSKVTKLRLTFHSVALNPCSTTWYIPYCLYPTPLFAASKHSRVCLATGGSLKASPPMVQSEFLQIHSRVARPFLFFSRCELPFLLLQISEECAVIPYGWVGREIDVQATPVPSGLYTRKTGTKSVPSLGSLLLRPSSGQTGRTMVEKIFYQKGQVDLRAVEEEQSTLSL